MIPYRALWCQNTSNNKFSHNILTSWISQLPYIFLLPWSSKWFVNIIRNANICFVISQKFIIFSQNLEISFRFDFCREKIFGFIEIICMKIIHFILYVNCILYVNYPLYIIQANMQDTGKRPPYALHQQKWVLIGGKDRSAAN